MRLIVLIISILLIATDSYATICSATIAQGSSEQCNVITQHGITWTLSANATVGQFVNGDYWVVDPGSGVEIDDIDPGYKSSPRDMNGSMINPRTLPQGYDELYNVGLADYSASVNVGIGVSPSTPLVLTSNSSLVSTISYNQVDTSINPQQVNSPSYVGSVAVLTCLSSAPASGSFRPGISHTTKTLHNISSLDYTKLQKKEIPSGLSVTPSVSTMEASADILQMVFLDHGGWTARYMKAVNSGMFDNFRYGFDWTEAALQLHLNFTDGQKERLLINYIQLGIDLYSFIEAGPQGELTGIGGQFYGWQPDGGFQNSRKWPILFAGIMLDYAPMKNIGQRSGDYLYSGGHGPGNPPTDYVHFGDDGQTFYVAQSDVDITNGPTWNPMTDTAPNYPYTTAMIGMPEWGVRYATNPNQSDAAWTANYRAIDTGAGVCYPADVMCALLTPNGKTLWNHNAFFDYVDRYMEISQLHDDPFGYTVPRQTESATARPTSYLQGKMYDTYRRDYPYPPYGAGGNAAFNGAGNVHLSGTSTGSMTLQ